MSEVLAALARVAETIEHPPAPPQPPGGLRAVEDARAMVADPRAHVDVAA